MPRLIAKSDEMAKKSLYNMLVQNTSVFHRLPSGKFGLSSWYPDARKKRRRRRKGENDEDQDPETQSDGSDDEQEEA